MKRNGNWIMATVVVLGFAAPAVWAQGDPMTAPSAFPAQPSANPQAVAQSNRTSPGVQQVASAEQSQESAGHDLADASTMLDRMFLRKAAQGGMAQVKLGQLAVQKGTSEDVKRLGQKMVDDHTKLGASLEPFGQELGVSTPKRLSKQDQAELDKLNGLSGEDFNREYLAYERTDHHKDLTAFQEELANTQNPDLREAVTAGQKVVARHTRWIDTLAAANSVPNLGK